MNAKDFPQKLQLVLKVLVVSRAGLASALNVDKSLVGRWASGAVTPSEHNLANLTRYVAERIDGFTVLDWERPLDEFTRRIGADGQGPATSIPQWIPSSFIDEAKRSANQRGDLYCGLWKTTRPSHDLPGRFVHDITLITNDRGDGALSVKIGVEGVRYEGWSLLLQHQTFGVSFDQESGTMLFSIYNGVARQKPQVLDGMNLATLRDAGGSPAASVCVLHRIADVTGNREEDEAMFEKAVAELNPLAPEGSIDPALARHLTRDAHAEAEGVLRLLFSRSMSRGANLSEIAGGAK
ncbi:hypothetical protein [Parvularcula lutaonensis]|uniref:HTH cro/C1-type domain-containing protein n=1 Tax=Parvularcula lutaonensis TaxID=491923 RepID=A0ABV7MCZ1_9PROT|nr:hypothetical protein [Parvularcula lutaonensis]GGY52018.1 hypothetical protein GCM10007148_21280 [Parvularcula lutaonensis]